MKIAADLAENYPEFDIHNGADFVEIYDSDQPHKLIENLSNKLTSQLSQSKKLLSRYAEFERTQQSGGKLDFDDLRVREWTKEETQKVQDYMSAQSMLQSIVVSFAFVEYCRAQIQPEIR